MRTRKIESVREEMIARIQQMNTGELEDLWNEYFGSSGNYINKLILDDGKELFAVVKEDYSWNDE